MQDVNVGDLVMGPGWASGRAYIGFYKGLTEEGHWAGPGKARIEELNGSVKIANASMIRPLNQTFEAEQDPESGTPVRAEVLREAEKLITGDRNAAYGSPTQNFQDTAKIWTVQLGHKLKDGAVIDPGEVASLMIGLKLARIKASPKLDNWMDIAGYAGCGAEADTETGKISD